MANLSKFTAAENKRLKGLREKARYQSLPILGELDGGGTFRLDDVMPVPMPLPKSKPKVPIKRNKGGPILMSPRKQMACGGKVHK
jgi:hypothetical protein